MDLNLVEEKLKKIHSELSESTTKLEETAQNIYHKVSNQEEFDEISENNAQREYYSLLSDKEKEYQIKNEEYKKLISNFSLNYLELCEWYKGPELPRREIETFFNSKDDLNQLYFLFIMGFMLQMGT